MFSFESVLFASHFV